MKKQPAKPKLAKKKSSNEAPPGATRKALDRPLEPAGGPPGAGAGPRHAADDVGSESETFGRSDATRSPASEPMEEEDALEKGPPYSGPSGGAIGGSPAQLRSSEGPAESTPHVEESDAVPAPVAPRQAASSPADAKIRLTGDAAIEYAEKQGLALNKHPDSITGPRIGLSVAEAQAIADDDPDLIWLDVSRDDYYSGPPMNYGPEA